MTIICLLQYHFGAILNLKCFVCGKGLLQIHTLGIVDIFVMIQITLSIFEKKQGKIIFFLLLLARFPAPSSGKRSIISSIMHILSSSHVFCSCCCYFISALGSQHIFNCSSLFLRKIWIHVLENIWKKTQLYPAVPTGEKILQ